jgi:beta-lactamase superfamily II metal-dependent hydrolase
VALLYVPFVVWGIRRWVGVSRAMVMNVALAVITVAAGWYAFAQPRGELKIQVLNVGQGSCALIRMPGGDFFLVNAGSRDTPNVVGRAVAPAMRRAGAQHLDGLLLTSLTTRSAQSAASVIEQFHPPIVLTSPIEWEHRDWTFAGASVEGAIAGTAARLVPLACGSTIRSLDGVTIRALWPPKTIEPPTPASLILLAEYRGRQILLMEPSAANALTMVMFNDPSLRADAAIVLGPEPSPKSAEPLKTLLARSGARMVFWSGRTPWAPPANDSNTARGFIELSIGPEGKVARQK